MAIVKEAVFETCEQCQSRKRVSDEVRGCDVCNRVFTEDGPALSCDIFNRGDSDHKVARIDGCSWVCILRALKKVECDYFISLPYLHFDNETPKGARAEDFWHALQSLAAEASTNKNKEPQRAAP